MRGRATGVVLPALVVLGLIAVVAIASTGSTPGGSNDTRAPSESLLDTLFTLGLVAVLAGGVLLAYGLTQRKAIAREIASGRYPRSHGLYLVCLFAVIMALSWWRYQHWTPPQPPDEIVLAPGQLDLPPTTSESEQLTPYEPSVAWLPIAVVVALVLAGVVAYLVSGRRVRRARDSDHGLEEQLAVVLDETLDDLRAEADPRRAIIAAYARLERVLAANGIPRHTSETPDEYLPRVLHDLALDAQAVERLTALFTRAKFSHHDVDRAMKEEAIDALEQVRDELRLARERPQPAPEAPLVGASS